MSDYLMRSLLFVPAHNKKLMDSAIKTNTDILLFDIEDSVQPLENKQKARDLVRKMVSEGAFKEKVIFPRINDRESGQLLKDVNQLTIDGISGFMYPKAKKGEDIYFFDKLLETIEYEKGIPVGTFKIIPLIETASAVLNAQDICNASSRVIAIAYGSEDFIADLEGQHDLDHESLFVPRNMIAMAARACKVIPIDTVHVRVKDLEDLEKNLILSKKLGYEGMLCLNPLELPLVHRYFSPSEQDIKEAKEILKLDKEARENNQGVAIMNGKFIGPPFVLKANKILEKYKKIQNK
ncbi:HpcH/HpaI aldolase/citrate lyase family protein [Tenacibaculum discolor]|uniref:HpcH/HpaI aldolase/citrate lyase family protein n=1 Tax=Tenacibaculum discolor TaxID=361581 RepID=UPI000EB2976C|nr:CoA ester lyase [Tenacibaculum discolor]RLJ97689.1 citrate lyase subunit beta/citryl-CoA lyase [Tenacibaculum discolor]